MKTRLIILFLFLGCLSIKAQDHDTSVFFRYAATFDQLLPDHWAYLGALPDSADVALFNTETKKVSLRKKITSETQMRANDATSIRLPDQHMQWDANGRMTYFSTNPPDDSLATDEVQLMYQSGMKYYSVIRNRAGEQYWPDTLSFLYNRSGWVSTWRQHEQNVQGSTVVQGNRMYDNRGRVIVASGMKYGPLDGTYMYEFNNDNQLVRRVFTTAGSGVVLCTDTLEYAYQSESKSVMTVTHKLKVTGMEKWVTLESKSVYPYSGVLLTYSDFNDADTNYFYRNLPSYSVQYEYDDQGRLVTENFGSDITPSLITAKYYYGKYNQPDSIVYTERIIEKKSNFTRIYSRDVRTYDNTGRIMTRTVTTLLHEEKGKKDTFVPFERVRIEYIWK